MRCACNNITARADLCCVYFCQIIPHVKRISASKFHPVETNNIFTLCIFILLGVQVECSLRHVISDYLLASPAVPYFS